MKLSIMIKFSALFMAESKFVKSSKIVSMLILNKTSDPSHKMFFGTFSDHAGITSACRAHASSSTCFQRSKLKNTDTRN